jgi:hypothetical protein
MKRYGMPTPTFLSGIETIPSRAVSTTQVLYRLDDYVSLADTARLLVSRMKALRRLGKIEKISLSWTMVKFTMLFLHSRTIRQQARGIQQLPPGSNNHGSGRERLRLEVPSFRKGERKDKE